MTWYAYVAIAVLGLGALATINAVGKKRDPITPELASATVIVQGLLIWAIIALAH